MNAVDRLREGLAEAAAMADLYERVKRPCAEGSLSEAITLHSQACGLVAYVFNVHPDDVAVAVQQRAARAETENSA